MPDDLPETVAPNAAANAAPPGAQVLRREALLPTERSRGLGTVAVVCTMAGVASGLALATTLMAMQVADSMSSRGCPYRDSQNLQVDTRPDHGFLGIRYVFHHGYADIDSVLPGTPAAAADLRRHDRVLSINNVRITSTSDLQERIFGARPGSTATLVVEREGEVITVRPTLVAWPSITY
ncbi:MAG: PDZ domain-containing protein [Myxococcales bacterium]|nr:PDZ domain-containing protein [Myxococcales bacterium]